MKAPGRSSRKSAMLSYGQCQIFVFYCLVYKAVCKKKSCVHFLLGLSHNRMLLVESVLLSCLKSAQIDADMKNGKFSVFANIFQTQ